MPPHPREGAEGEIRLGLGARAPGARAPEPRGADPMRERAAMPKRARMWRRKAGMPSRAMDGDDDDCDNGE